MPRLYLATILVHAILSKSTTAAALPRIDDGLGAQLTDDSNTGFSSAIPIATQTQSPTAQTSLTGLTRQGKSPPVQLISSQPAKPKSSDISPISTRISQFEPSPTAFTEQNDSLEAQSPNAINHVFDPSTNTTIITIPLTANSTSRPPPIQDNGLLAQDTNSTDTVFDSDDNSTINIDPQPVNESIIQVSRQENGVPQQQSQKQQRQPPPPPDNGLQAQTSNTEINFPPQPLPLKFNITKPANPVAIPSSSSPSPTTTITTPTTSALPFVPQDNGLQAQDVSGENDDFSAQSNQTYVNYPHQFRDPQTGELLLPAVQDDGLQAQDSGGSNVDWSEGEEYGGGLGGQINVPTLVNGGIVDQSR